jgi:aryl-alcohol dehydrogenase-like predicted oxidoreductase
VRHGIVRYVGVSNWAAWQIVKALGIAERWARALRELQAYYTIAGRDLERELVPMLQQRRARPDGVEPARRRPAQRQVRPRREQAMAARRATFDFPPVDKERAWDCIDAMREDRRGARRLGRAGRARLAAAPAAVTSVIVGAKRPDQLRR